jgi:hypothetical protein
MPPESPGRLVLGRVSWCCSLPPDRGPRNLGSPAAPVPAPGRRARPSPACLIAGHDGSGYVYRRGAAADQATSPPSPVGTMNAANTPKPWESSAPFNKRRAAAGHLEERGQPITRARLGAPAGPSVNCCLSSAPADAPGRVGDSSTGTVKTWQPTGMGWPAARRLAASAPPGPQPAARCRPGVPPAGCPRRGPGTVSGNARPLVRVREPAALPHRQLILTPFWVPANNGAPFQGRACRTRRQ